MGDQNTDWNYVCVRSIDPKARIHTGVDQGHRRCYCLLQPTRSSLYIAGPPTRRTARPKGRQTCT